MSDEDRDEATPAATPPRAASPPTFDAPPPVPPPPGRPPTVGMPRDGRVAFTAALLNLGGLGLGYLYLRRWLRALPSLTATAALLWAALPATAEGVPGAWPALFAGLALLTAVDGWRLGRPPTLGGPRLAWVPASAGVLLLALPVAGAVSFADAQRRALESDLGERLAAADRLVAEAVVAADFADAEPGYRSALDEYLAVRAAHPDTDAAGEVPGRLDSLYERATAEGSGGDWCAALDPLWFFRALPGELDEAEARRLAGRAGEDLPEPLHGCGLGLAEEAGARSAAEPLAELLAEYPDSEYAGALPGELGELQAAATDAVGGAEPCQALTRLRSLNGLFGRLPGPEFSTLAEEGAATVPEGLYRCGTDHFTAGRFGEADGVLGELVEDHPDHRRAERAGDILIAARIAAHLPEAGAELPPEPGTAGGGSVTLELRNDSPYALEFLFTGPLTGSRTLDGCDGCEVYPDDPGDAACSADLDYPTVTVELPAGDYYFLHSSPDEPTRELAESDQLDPDYVYTYCSYITEDDLGGPWLDDPGTDA
ncbi:hypothetical protein [Streptomyces sp. NPDC127098]|uniref:hypothetical protein n=1 Tax=Streptomyces sp. NPDC127098 TaxID=3347137 RepID=UPI003648C858